MNQKARQILQKADVERLPSLPHVLLQLLDICHAESLSYDELSAILKRDAALYAQFSSMHIQCNPSDKGQYNPESTLEQNLEQLDVNTIKSVAVTTAVHQFFSRTSIDRTDFLKRHWHHSLYCATVAESIAKLCKYQNPGEAYSAGLLHDIGQLVLETAYPDKYTAIVALSNEDENLHANELKAFGATHPQIGAELLSKHGANSFICDAVLYHHENVNHIIDAHPLVKIIFLANSLTNRHFKETDQETFEVAEQFFGLNKPVILEMLKISQERVSSTAQAMEIIVSSDGIDGIAAEQHSANDEFKQVQLAEQVRNIALLDGIHQHLSRSEGQASLLNIISQHVCLLFGVNHCILFLYDTASNRVNAISADNQPAQLTDLSIPLTADRSLVTDALLKKQITHSFDSDKKLPSIVDRQLIGITRQDGIICLPMMMNNVAVGTLVLGADITLQENLLKQTPLLMRFVNEIAHTISVNSYIDGSAANDNQHHNPLQQKIREVLHEVRNPLSIMNNYLGILSYKLEDDKPAQEDVQTIKSEIKRINGILNHLTEAENSTDETTPININAIISNLTNIFQTSLFTSKNIQISIDLDERIESLQSNANAFKQIYTNLIKNAVEALPANGLLMVYTQDNVNVDGKQHIELTVADNGPGIDNEIMSRLFSPIETLKGEDHAGLGLTIVKNLVNELHGTISCRSSDKGASFHVLLPKVTE